VKELYYMHELIHSFPEVLNDLTDSVVEKMAYSPDFRRIYVQLLIDLACIVEMQLTGHPFFDEEIRNVSRMLPLKFSRDHEIQDKLLGFLNLFSFLVTKGGYGYSVWFEIGDTTERLMQINNSASVQ
jgi:hypothetical protein